MRSAQLIAAWLVFGWCLQALANDPAARVKTSLATQGELWIGQRVIVVIELATPGIFSSVPAFDLPDVPGVVLVAPEGSPVIGTETVSDISFTTQRHELSVYSQRAGDIEIPGFSIRFESSNGFGKPTVEQSVVAPKLVLTIKRPPGTDRLKSVVTTDRMAVHEKWQPEFTQKDLKLGSAFTRTIEIEAHDVPGMLLPELLQEELAGLKAYWKSPVVDDRLERGDLTGRRIDTVTYVCERPGKYSLPSLAFAWWDRASQKLNRIELPGHLIEVAEPAHSQPPPSPESPHERKWIWSMAVVWGVILFLAVSVCRNVASAIHRRPDSSEATAFADFQNACRSSDGHAIYRYLFAWLNQFITETENCSLDSFLKLANDERLTSDLKSLERQLYGQGTNPPAVWDGQVLLHGVTQARTRLKYAGSHRVHSAELPGLNPGR